ncbi:hypothetical protein [Asanoa siamensis]|uniref:Uncharacterized protein n=1 Tax=Asanoa siamensis TaxID=926357 RepID=A0ABQ4CJT3_9ACTN|nr:hypothetical protein [Asanoa siamensis]GIF71552.1 hypothetical protein Asi02nite_10700 [Asanoa siamensis]
MAGWSAVCGTHDFTVPSEAHARSLAEALAAYGFPLVTARPARRAGEWIVTALDEGPYPADLAGHRTIDAVGRRAALVARRHAGCPSGGSRADHAMLALVRPADTPVVSTNPGGRPPVPTVVVALAPPRATLRLTPDHVTDGPIDLSGVDRIAWADLEHAHGPADDVPDLLRALAADGDWPDALDDLCGDFLIHQGTCFSATAPAVAFLTDLVVSGALPAARRLDLYAWLLVAADRPAADLLADAARAVVRQRPPAAGFRAREVRHTVGARLPALLSCWDREPAANRFALTCLAALFHRPCPDEVDGPLDGTQPGSYLDLARALAHGRDGAALALAADIVAWGERHNPGWLEAPGVSDRVKAGHVLVRGALGVFDDAEA